MSDTDKLGDLDGIITFSMDEALIADLVSQYAKMMGDMDEADDFYLLQILETDDGRWEFTGTINKYQYH